MTIEPKPFWTSAQKLDQALRALGVARVPSRGSRHCPNADLNSFEGEKLVASNVHLPGWT